MTIERGKIDGRLVDMLFDETAGAWIETPANPYRVGEVWYASWGYDQTNVDYFVVTRETAASVWLAPIAGYCARDGRLYPDPDRIGTPAMHRKGKGSDYVHIDYVRTAWPYTGGGRYETNAAGHIGH